MTLFLFRLKIIFRNPVNRSQPVIRQFLKSCFRGYSLIGITDFRIINLATALTYVPTHPFAFLSNISVSIFPRNAFLRTCRNGLFNAFFISLLRENDASLFSLFIHLENFRTEFSTTATANAAIFIKYDLTLHLLLLFGHCTDHTFAIQK